jgi:hypothetical protein
LNVRSRYKSSIVDVYPLHFRLARKASKDSATKYRLSHVGAAPLRFFFVVPEPDLARLLAGHSDKDEIAARIAGIGNNVSG